MPQTPHVERHFRGSKTVRDIVIGMSDGLTVPFALAAGLSAAVNATSIIVTAGLAEIAAEAIAMGLGGYWPHGAMPSTTTRSGRARQQKCKRSRRWRRRRWQTCSAPMVSPRKRSSRCRGVSKAPRGVGGFHDAIRAGA